MISGNTCSNSRLTSFEKKKREKKKDSEKNSLTRSVVTVEHWRSLQWVATYLMGLLPVEDVHIEPSLKLCWHIREVFVRCLF